MKKTVRWLILLILAAFFLDGVSLAGSINLMRMSDSGTGNMSRFSFFFDRLPPFRIDTSGQRVRLQLPQTRFAKSFKPITPEEARPPLVLAKAAEHGAESTVELYFRETPGFVDVTCDERQNRLDVNISWGGDGKMPGARRPGAARGNAVTGGVTPRQIALSRYAGRWLEFFREFQWADPLAGKPEAAAYAAAVAKMKEGDPVEARRMLQELAEHNAGTAAGFKARMKMVDIDLLAAKAAADIDPSCYQAIIEKGPTRAIREEAAFKQIVAGHLNGDNLGAVKRLGRFLEDYWAGPLNAEAESLLLELMPLVIGELVRKEEYIASLALVAKHRDILAQAPISRQFLKGLAKSYSEAGFLEQAAATYRYILDGWGDPGEKGDLFLPLIEIYCEQMKFDQVREYAALYLAQYPGGKERNRIWRLYADAMLREGDVQGITRELHEKKWPADPDLDSFAGDLSFRVGRPDLAEYYFSRASADGGQLSPGLNLKRAEALFAGPGWEASIPLYESLLDAPGIRGQAGYRLVQAFVRLGENQKAVSVYTKMAEMNVRTEWLELAGATVHVGEP